MKILLPLFIVTVAAFHCITAASANESKPHVVLVVGTHHYSPELTLPVFATELERFGFRTTVVMGDGDPEKKTKNVLPGIEVLAEADVVIFFMRFLKLPDSEWQPIEDYLQSGKPVIGLRTANHSFKYPKNHARSEWNDGFGRLCTGDALYRSPNEPNANQRDRKEQIASDHVQCFEIDLGIERNALLDSTRRWLRPVAQRYGRGQRTTASKGFRDDFGQPKRS